MGYRRRCLDRAGASQGPDLQYSSTPSHRRTRCRRVSAAAYRPLCCSPSSRKSITRAVTLGPSSTIRCRSRRCSSVGIRQCSTVTSAAHPVQLADVAPPEAAQEGAQGGWRLDHTAQGAGCPAGAQHIGIVDAVAARQRRGHQSRNLIARIGSAWRIAQAQVQGQRGGKDQPGIVDQAVVVEGDADAVGVVAWQHLLGAPCFWLVFCLENHYPRRTGALSYPFNPPRHSSFRWIRAKPKPSGIYWRGSLAGGSWSV